jgi:plasmid replication initiation protein
MAMLHLPLPSELVKKSNALARSKWQSESLWEQRIVALVASKVHEADEDFFTYRIPVAELTGVSDANLSGFQYEEIKKSILRLGKAAIYVPGKNPRNFMQYTIFAKCGYEDGFIVAGFHPDLKPHYLQLKGKFTEFSLMQFMMLPSSYSQKMFEFIKSWSGLPEKTILVDELHDFLDSPDSLRNDFRQFRTRVLEKSYKDIHEKTTLRFKWEPVKKGKRVESIRFIFSKSRREIAEATAKKLKQAKQSTANNKIVNEAVKCFNEKGSTCKTSDNKKKVCEICNEFINLNKTGEK